MKTINPAWASAVKLLAAWSCLLLPSVPLATAQTGSNTNLPLVSVRAADPYASEPGVLTVVDDGVFRISRSHGTNLELRVNYALGGTALNGVDYAPLPNQAVIPRGAFWTDVIVRPLDDALPEGTETVVLRLLEGTGYSRAGSAGEAVVSIFDNDPPPPPPVVNIVATDPEAAETFVVPPGMGMPQREEDVAVFTVTRSGDPTLALEVFYTISGTAANGADYQQLSGKVTIPAGARAAPIEVVPIDDNLVEGTETVVITLSPIACIAIYPPPPWCYAVGPSNQATAWLRDNDPPTNLPPMVRLIRPANGEVFAAPARIGLVADTVDNDGYVPHIEFYADATLIGQETRLFLVPPPPGQHIVYEMLWTNVPPGCYALRARATDDQGAAAWSDPVRVWVMATNWPPPTNLPIVSIRATDPLASEGRYCLTWPGWPCDALTNACIPNTATFVIRRHGDTNVDLTVHYAIGGTASNGVDYLELPGVVTIPAGQHRATITVVPIDDRIPEGLETVVLALRLPADCSADLPPPWNIRWPWKAAAVIADNDQPRPTSTALPDRCFHFMRPAANGTCWRIEASTDLLNWWPVGTNLVTEGAVHFVDAEASEAPRRFYRAVPLAGPPAE